MSKSAAVATHVGAAEKKGNPLPKGRILAVDDQRYFRELIEGMLVESGYEALTVSTAEEAVRVLAHSSFDVVLTDLVMPAMDGIELVRRIKERDPDQDVVVVTGVVDVRTAVEAMKLGATDYLLKPFDAATLSTALDAILKARRLRTEHARLLAENIEYLGERTLFERAIGLFSTTSLGPLTERIVEALCLETQAQGCVIWVADVADSEALNLASARGLVRAESESETLRLDEIPEGLSARGARSLVMHWGAGLGARRALFLALRRDSKILAVARLSDKLGGGEFDEVDRSCAEKLLRFGEMALANALRIRSLERRSLQDPVTGAYVLEYFEDLTLKEIEKAKRTGRGFSVLKLDLGHLDEHTDPADEPPMQRWLCEVAEILRDLMRSTDVVASDGESVFYVLLTESDALGAAVFRQRVRYTLARSGSFEALDPAIRPEPRVGVASYPSDGTQQESLMRTLDARVEDERSGAVAVLGLQRMELAAALRTLLAESDTELIETSEQIVRFVLGELAQRPRERGLLYVVPGAAFAKAVIEGLAALGDTEFETEVCIVSASDRPAQLGARFHWIQVPADRDYPPFLVRFGDAPAYALVRDEKALEDGARLFHTSDRSLVEHLMFQLQSELGAAPAGLS